MITKVLSLYFLSALFNRETGGGRLHARNFAETLQENHNVKLHFICRNWNIDTGRVPDDCQRKTIIMSAGGIERFPRRKSYLCERNSTEDSNIMNVKESRDTTRQNQSCDHQRTIKFKERKRVIPMLKIIVVNAAITVKLQR